MGSLGRTGISMPLDVRDDSKKHYDYREYVCGWAAAFVNINVTFPISKMIFRQMLHGVETKSAIKMLHTEGLRYLYRGIGPPLMQRSISTSIMFGSFAQYRKFLDSEFGRLHGFTNENIRFFTAALMAGSTEAILCPFERVQMLLQDHTFHKHYNNTFDAFVKLQKFGIKEYYRGLTAILCRNGPSNALFFSFRNEPQIFLPKIDKYENELWCQVLKNFISGACVGALISSVFYPVNVIRTQMQTRPPGSPFISIAQAVKDVYIERDRSVRKMFYGVHANYSRAFLSWGIINASYEVFRKLLYGFDE